MSGQTPTAPAGRPSGLFASLRDLLATLLAIAETRLELVTTELEEELHRIAEILAWAFVLIFFGGMTVLMLALLIIVLWWEDHRVLAASLTCLGFLLITATAALVLRARVAARPKLLDATIEELKRDRDALGGGA